MKPWWGIPIFAAGVVAGWAVAPGPGGKTSGGVADGSGKVPPRRSLSRIEPTEHPSKWRTFGKNAARMTEVQREEFLKNLPSSDRAAALAALVGQAGPDGLRSDLQQTVRAILGQWAEEDFDGVWDWSGHCEPEGFRSYVKSLLLDKLVEKDPERALALHLETEAGDPEFSSSVIRKIVARRTEEGSDAFIEMIGSLPWGHKSGASDMKFAPEFDFRKAADAVVALRKGDKGSYPPAWPANFLETWASRDAAAAAEWWIANGELPFSQWGDILTGVEKAQGQQAAAAWAAGVIESSPDRRQSIISGIVQASNPETGERVGRIAGAIQDTGTRDRFLGDYFASVRFKDSLTRYAFVLTRMSSAETRLEAIKGLRAQLHTSLHLDVSDAQLQEWGITRMQLDQIGSGH